VPTEQNPETTSTHLRRLILSQSVEGTAVPMVLFSDETLAAGGDDTQPEEVARTAGDLGIDLVTLDLFSFDAYRLQSGLGQGLAP
jgi:hypothetical protein